MSRFIQLIGQQLSTLTLADKLKNVGLTWVCPITGTSFQASDTLGIEKHINHMLARESEQIRQQEKARKIKEYSKAPKTFKSFDEFVEKTNVFLKDTFGEFCEVPQFKVLFTKVKTGSWTEYAVICVTNKKRVSKEICSLFTWVNNNEVTLMPQDFNGEYEFIACHKSICPFFAKLWDWQHTVKSKKQIALEISDFLTESTEYVSMTEDIKKMAAEIHALREKLAAKHRVRDAKKKELLKSMKPVFKD